METVLGLLMLAVTTTNPVSTPENNTNNFLENTTENVVLNVPFVHQVNDLPEDKKAEIGSTACGPASLSMILKYNGYHLNFYDVIEELPTTVYIKGSMFYDLKEGAKPFGFEPRSVKNSYESLYNELKNQNPVIMNIQNYDGITGHAIVVVGMKGFDGKKADALIVHDPWIGAYRTFDYIDENALRQPEGYNLYIGSMEPFVFE